MTAVAHVRTWAEWRAYFEQVELVRPMSARARAERAASVSPLVSLEVLDDYELWAEWDSALGMYVARCAQMPGVWWPHAEDGVAAVLALGMCLEAFIVGLNSDLCLVPGMAERSDAAEQRWHLNARQAHEAHLGTLGIANEGDDV